MPLDPETLRKWRRSRGWDIPELARRIRRAAAASGDPAAAHHGLVRMIRAWERGDHVISERYELLYRAVIVPGQGGPAPPRTTTPGRDLGKARALAAYALGRARDLPGPAEIVAIEAAALARARTEVSEAEIRALGVTAITQLQQITETVARLVRLLGDNHDHAGGGDD